jgi:predicted esterase
VEQLNVFHYHGEEDIPISVQSVRETNERSWIKEGFKKYQFFTEKGLGHDISLVGYQKANQFILNCINAN